MLARLSIRTKITIVVSFLLLAMSAMGVNSSLMIPLEDGAKTAVTAITLFLRSSQRIKDAGGLRLFSYRGVSAASPATTAHFCLRRAVSAA